MDAEVTSTGQTFSLAGPKTYTIEQLLLLVESLTFEKICRPGLNIPHWAMRTTSRITDRAWWPMLSPDEVDRRFVDDLPDEPGTKTFADLAIMPDVLEEVAIIYLRRYRSHLHFEQPVETSGSRLRKGRYRVVD